MKEVSLHNLPIKDLNNPLLLEELRDMYDLLTEKGVLHGDPRLHNFLRVHQRIVAIDFELSEPLTSKITNEHGLETLKDDIKRRVREAQGTRIRQQPPCRTSAQRFGPPKTMPPSA